MGGDADFEHARLLIIHKSVVVSARSVMGIFDFGPWKHFVIPLGFRGWVHVSLLILLFYTKDPTTLYLYSRWIPITIQHSIKASEVAAVLYIVCEDKHFLR